MKCASHETQINKDHPCIYKLRSLFDDRLLLIRDELRLTRMEFADELAMDRSGHIDIEHRKSLCFSRGIYFYFPS